MGREVLSTDLMPKGLNDGVISWNALRLGIAAVEVIADKDAMSTLETEKFMEDELVIVIHRSTDKNALEKVPVGVNGETAWLPRDTKIRLPRKFVERLARAQEATFRTDDNPDPRMDEGKVIRRTNGQVFPFQVLHDPSPRGQAWLAKVTREG
jgi:hypothetical protein